LPIIINKYLIGHSGNTLSGFIMMKALLANDASTLTANVKPLPGKRLGCCHVSLSLIQIPLFDLRLRKSQGWFSALWSKSFQVLL